MPPTNALPSSVTNSASTNDRFSFLMEVTRAYVREGDFLSAASAARRALELRPGDPEALTALSYAYISSKSYRKAEKILKQLASRYPDNGTAFNNLAWIYATSEDAGFRDGKRALSYAHMALVLTPDDYHVWNTLAETYYVLGNYERALRAAEHEVWLIQRNGIQLLEKERREYSMQIRKCRWAVETQNALKEMTDHESE